MPVLPARAFQILLLVVRETYGQFDIIKGKYRERTRGVTYNAIRKRCGISSYQTVSDNLKILLASKCIKSNVATGQIGGTFEQKTYRVNPDLVLHSVEDFREIVRRAEIELDRERKLKVVKRKRVA